ncbi:MAG TPA: YceI family protein, partial [Chitinophagaceae bacterium]|nr:YceI family protein [Chitinophagaceae bacterium]
KFAMGEMEEHFNKEYLESDKYPHAWFKGKLQDAGAIDLTKAGVYKVQAQGELVIHNVARQVTVAGSLQVDRSSITLRAKFQLNIEDYKIETGLGGIIIGDRMNVEVVAKCQ